MLVYHLGLIWENAVYYSLPNNEKKEQDEEMLLPSVRFQLYLDYAISYVIPTYQ